MAIIQIQDVSKKFQTKDGEIDALKHVTLDIEAGDIYGIIGMSGAGKSTLVRCINHIEVPTEGTVIVQDKDLSKLSEKELRKQREHIGMIFQHFNLLMQKSVIDNVCFPLYIKGKKKAEARKRAAELLEIVGLGDRQNAYPAQLSGGQKQRLCIARALLKRPKILILDDSTSAVDTATEAKIREAFSTTLKETTKLIIAQRIGSVMEADQIVVMDEGKIVGLGKHEDLLETCKAYQEIYDSQMKKEVIA